MSVVSVGVNGVSRCQWCQYVSVVSVCVSGVSMCQWCQYVSVVSEMSVGVSDSWVKTRGVVTIFTMTKCFTGFSILRYYSSK